jgi:hypothetical protein
MTTQLRDEDPLAMARSLMRMVGALADLQDGTPDAQVRAYIEGWGQKQHYAAEMAGQLALVSIAGDLRRLADVLAPPPGEASP